MGVLANRRILVTRPRGQGSGLAARLEELGATPILIPTVELAPPASWCGLDAALAAIRSFDWVIFTSANAVEAYAGRARRLGVQPQARRVAAIGAGTAKAVVEAGVADPVDLVPQRAVAESLAEALEKGAKSSAMLLVRAAVARDVLPERLEAAGARVTIAEAYRTVVAEGSIAELRELFETRPPDAITFTSGSTAHNLAALLEEAGMELPRGVVLASIGPITSQAMRERGWEPTVEAKEASVAGLVEAIVRAW